MLLRIFIFSLIFCFSAAHSQDLEVKMFNTDNGLPQNSVKDIVKDKYGFIWMATEDGLVRYDGVKFLIFNKFPLNNQRFSFFFGDTEKDSIFSHDDYENSVMIRNRNAQVADVSYTPEFFIKRKNYDYILLGNSIFSYGSAREGDFGVFINMKKGKYFFRENFSAYVPDGSENEKLINVKLKSGAKYNFFAIGESFFYVDRQSGKTLQIQEGDITARYDIPLLADPETTIYWSTITDQTHIINKNTVYRCSFINGKLTVKKCFYLEDLTNKSYTSIYYDDCYNTYYIGSSVDGLRIISFKEFAVSKRQDVNSTHVFYCSQPYNSTSVITPYGEIFDRNGFVADKQFQSTTPYLINYDREGNLIVKNDTSVITYNYTGTSGYRKSNTITTLESQLLDFEYDNNRYYVLYGFYGRPKNTGLVSELHIYEDSFYGVPGKKYRFNTIATKVKKIDEEHILVGTVKGLYKVSLKTDEVFDITPVKDIYIRNIVKTKDGNIWILTLGQGFFLYRNDRLVSMPLSIDKNTATSHTLMEDKKGFFWISTNNGLYRVRKTELLKYAEDRRYRVYYYRFSKEAGFLTNEFNGGGNISGNELANGEFVLPSLNGFVFFDPLKINIYYPHEIYVERAISEGKEIRFVNTMTVNQSPYRTDLFIDVPYYGNADNMVIMVKLDNRKDAEWELIGKDRKYSFSNLSYGNHKLYIKALASEDGKYINKEVNIFVPSFFYQTTWFKLLCALILCILIFLIVKLRINYLKRSYAELEDVINKRTQSLSDTIHHLEETKMQLNREIAQQKKLIGTITHDITTPVRFIALTSEKLLQKKVTNAESIDKILTYIQKSSIQLYNFTKTLKEYADMYNYHRSYESEWYSLYDLIEEKRMLFNEIAKNSNTVILNQSDPNLNTMISKNILSAIIHNLLDNSVKYTQDGTITITSCEKEPYIFLTISDTGIGMSKEKIEYYSWLQENIENEKLLLQKYGMGLHLVLQLLQMIECKIVFKKNVEKGTSCKLILVNTRECERKK